MTIKSGDKVVVRFMGGKVLKGYLDNFKSDSKVLTVRDAEAERKHSIQVDDLKAIFFVRSFKGDSRRRDKKAYGIHKSSGRKVCVIFKDGESVVGFVEGEFPWKKGFFLSGSESEKKGFFLVPVDPEGNNIKIFVVGSAIKYTTVMS